MKSKLHSNLAYSSPFFGRGVFDHDDAHDPFARVRQPRKLKKGETIFSAGEGACFVYRLVKGEADLFTVRELRESSSRAIEINEVLGLTEAIQGIPYETTARAVTSCTCEYIGRDDLIIVLMEDPEAAFLLAGSMAAHLQKLYQLFFSQ